MADIKWIKLSTDIFDNRKIKLLETLPEGDTIIVIWLKLLCLAGTCNDSGLVSLTKEIPYTEQMLASYFGRKLSTIKMALKTFQDLNMIEIIDNFINISNWEKYQSADKLEKIKEQTRLRVAKHREKNKLLLSNKNGNCNVTCNDKVTMCNDIELEQEQEQDIDIDLSIYQGKKTCNVTLPVDNFKKYYPELTDRQLLLIKEYSAKFGEDKFYNAFLKAVSKPNVKNVIAYTIKILSSEEG